MIPLTRSGGKFVSESTAPCVHTAAQRNPTSKAKAGRVKKEEREEFERHEYKRLTRFKIPSLLVKPKMPAKAGELGFDEADFEETPLRTWDRMWSNRLYEIAKATKCFGGLSGRSVDREIWLAKEFLEGRGVPLPPTLDRALKRSINEYLKQQDKEATTGDDTSDAD